MLHRTLGSRVGSSGRALESENLRTRVHTSSELDFTFFVHFPLNGSPKFGSN